MSGAARPADTPPREGPELIEASAVMAAIVSYARVLDAPEPSSRDLVPWIERLIESAEKLKAVTRG